MATAFNTMGATPSAPQIGPSSYSSLQSAGMTPQAKALNLSMAGSPSTVQPIKVQPSSATTGSASPQGLSMQQPAPAETPHPATAGILSAHKATTAALAGLSIGNPTDTATGQTPQQLATNNTSGVGAGSLDPTAGTQQNQQQNTQQQPQQYSNTNPPTYTGLVGQTANAGQNLIQNAQQDSPEVKAARVALQQSQTEESQALANIQGSPHTMNFAQGAENVIRNQYLANQSALSNTLNSAVTTQGQQFTAQNQGGGLVGTAAGLAAPQLGSIGQVPYSPLNGSQGSVLGSTQSGGVSAAGNLMGQFEGAKAVGAASGTGTANVLGSVPGLQAANTAAQGIANTVTSFLAQNPQLNQSNAAVVNAAQQWVQGKQLADPAYQTLFNYLNEYTNTLAPILGVGGDATNLKTEIAQSFVNAQASGQSIAQVLQSIGKLADDKVKNIQSGATGGGVVAGSPVSSGGSAGNVIKTNYGNINPDL